MTYSAIFSKLRDNLISSGTEIVHDGSEPVLTEGERNYYETEEGLFLHDDWFELFSSANGISLRWQMKGDPQLGGFFQLTDLLDFHDKPTENKLWVDWYEQDDIEEMKKHKILEMLHGNDAYITVKFEDDGSYNLYFVDGDLINHGGSKTLPKLPLTLKEYIQVITDYFGVYSLRYHLHKEEFYTNPGKYLPEYDALKKNINNFDPLSRKEK